MLHTLYGTFKKGQNEQDIFTNRIKSGYVRNRYTDTQFSVLTLYIILTKSIRGA